MSKAARANTAPEVALRSELHRRGLRFRLHVAVPGDRRRKIDIVFGSTKVAVFVDGCFWHSCPEHGTMPKANEEFWRRKLAGNHIRDRETDARLRALGWDVVRVWEHEEISSAADRVEAVVRTRRASRGQEEGRGATRQR
jgi:DNA mismatch endonuclease (patch repair protein)